MAEEGNEAVEQYFDWRGREAEAGKHGGVRAAAFACVVEVLENMVFLANANNFVSYFMKSMHYPGAKAANMVTNFMGTSFLLTIFGGFIADSFLTRFATFVISCSIEILGLVMLTIQAENTKLPPNKTPSSSQAAVLYTGLYAIAAGVGGIKASLPAHGADQLDSRNKRQISAFFNWYFFSLCTGGLIASTVMVWVEDAKGWNWSFKISDLVMSLALCVFVSGFPLYRYKRPGGSPFTRIFRVFASAVRNRNDSVADAERGNTSLQKGMSIHQHKFRFLDKALADNNISETEVEETRTFLSLLPIFGSTIMMNCCLAQLQTFSVQQGIVMNRKLSHSFEIPVQSLTVLPLMVMLSSLALYELFGLKMSGKTSGRNSVGVLYEPLNRIGVGLALSSIAMAVAAAVEVKRRSAAVNHGEIISVFWLGFQYLMLGVSDMLTLGGMLEFFYREAAGSMRSMSTSLSWCSTAFGFFLSSVLVDLTSLVSGWFGTKWLGGSDVNRTRLDLFYVLLFILNTLNLLNYIYCAKKY